MDQPTPKTNKLTSRQRRNLLLLIMALLIYIVATLAASPHRASSPLIHSVWVILVLSVTIIGLLFLAWWAGFYAWLELDRYTDRLAEAPARKAFVMITRGMWWLAAGLILSSLMSVVQQLLAGNAGVAAALTEANFFVITAFPFLGFLYIRNGSRHLAVMVQAMMSVRSKLMTVGPPVALLAAFYIFMLVTNSTPATVNLMAGPAGFLFLPVNVVLVVGSWVLGLLAALNIERATYRGEGAQHAQPLVMLYNGILTTTGGFIILDAIMSLGAARLLLLPVGAIVLLIYAFIGVVALGFWIVALAGRQLLASTAAPKRER